MLDNLKLKKYFENQLIEKMGEEIKPSEKVLLYVR
jgi:hypothetical protein